MGCGQFCCFPSPGYVIGRGIPAGPADYGAMAGAGYGVGSRAVPVPVTATSQVMVASYMPPAASVVGVNQLPITTVPSRNVYVPSYGQSSVINAPYVPSVVQPISGNIVAPVQPYGVSSVRPY